jgi:DNA-binding MarR family transcriptional regulator
VGGYAEKIYVLVHLCHEQCLKLMRVHKNDDELTALGLSIQQGIILKLLLAGDKMTQKELTQKLQITSSSCGSLIAKLEQGGYLERCSNPDDKRTYRVVLTETGRDLGRAYKSKSVIFLEKWADDLTEQEKEQLYCLLSKLYDGLEKQSNKYVPSTTLRERPVAERSRSTAPAKRNHEVK